MNVVSYEFFECVGDGGVVDDFSYEGDDVDGVECLGKVYCFFLYIYLYPQGQRFTEPLQGPPSTNQARPPPLQGSTTESPGPDL